MTGASFGQQTGELTSTDHHDQRTSGDTSPHSARCRGRGGRGRLRTVMGNRTEATTTPVSYGMTPRGGATTAHSSHSHPFHRPKGTTAEPILANGKHACHYGGGSFGAALPSPETTVLKPGWRRLLAGWWGAGWAGALVTAACLLGHGVLPGHGTEVVVAANGAWRR